jgi:hypothetical protein
MLQAPRREDGHGSSTLIHMPKPTILPLLVAVSLFVLGYGVLFHVLWVELAAGAGLAVSLHRSMLSVDPGTFAVPDGGPRGGTTDGTDATDQSSAGGQP